LGSIGKSGFQKQAIDMGCSERQSQRISKVCGEIKAAAPVKRLDKIPKA